MFTFRRPTRGVSTLKPGLSGNDLQPILFERNMARLTGVATGVIDSSGLSEKPGLRGNRDWSPVDDKYEDRRLYAVDPTVTAQIVNEMLGLGLIYLIAIPNITQERHWKNIFREYVQLSWSRIGPTGIPKTTGWISKVEEGSTSRFGFYVTIPIEMLANDEFGADNLMDELKVVPQTCVYTIMQEVSLQLAGRPTFNLFTQQSAGGQPFTYGMYYELANRYFGLAAMNPDAIITELTKMLTNSNNPKNAILVPNGCQWVFKEMTVENRVFPYHVRDFTKQLYQTANEFVKVGRGLNPVLNLSTGEDIMLVTVPTLHSTSFEPESDGLQPLQRHNVLAGAFVYEKPNYGTMETIHGNSSILKVSFVTKRNSGWHEIPQSKAINETHLGYMFAESGAGKDVDPSPSMLEALEMWGRDVTSNEYYRKYIRDVKDMNQPSEAARISLASGRKMHGFRDIPIGAHTINHLETGELLLDPTDTSFVEFVRQIGQFPECHLPSQHLIDICRAVKRTGGTPLNQAGKTRSMFAQILGRSEDYIGQTFSNNVQKIHIEVPGVPVFQNPETSSVMIDAESIPSQLAGLVEIVSHQNVSAGDDRMWYADTRKDSTGSVTSDGRVLKTQLERLFTRLPNSSIELFEPYVQLFNRYESEQKEAADKLFAQINEDIAPHSEAMNEGAIKLTSEKLISTMKAQGIIPSEELSPEASLPVITSKHISAIRRAKVDMNVLKAAGPILSADAPEWSYSRSLLQGTADAMDIDGSVAAEPLGAVVNRNRGARTSTPLTSSSYPIDHTRISTLENLLVGIPADELYMFVELLRLPNTVKTHARLADLGVMLFGGSLVRLREVYRCLSLLVCRSNGETCQTIMAPIISTFSNRGMVTMADFKFQFSLGVFWHNPRAIDEMRNVFMNGVASGIGTGIIRTIEGVKSLLSGKDSVLRGDMIYVIEPFSESNHSYPIALIPDMPISDLRSASGEKRIQAQEEAVYNRHSGYNLLSLLISPGVMENAGTLLMDSLEDIAKGGEPAFSPYIERQPTAHWNHKSGKFDRWVQGSGPRGLPIHHHAQNAWEIYNGVHGAQFPLEAADYV